MSRIFECLSGDSGLWRKRERDWLNSWSPSTVLLYFFADDIQQLNARELNRLKLQNKPMMMSDSEGRWIDDWGERTHPPLLMGCKGHGMLKETCRINTKHMVLMWVVIEVRLLHSNNESFRRTEEYCSFRFQYILPATVSEKETIAL